MKEQDFRKIFTLSQANPPALFHQRMEETLAGLVHQEENAMKASTKLLFQTGSRALALALIIALLLCSVALAAGLGLFGQLAHVPHEDKRLPALDQVSTPVNQVILTENGITATIQQAYYNGDRVFVSYRLDGPLTTFERGKGMPENVQFTMEEKGVICAKAYAYEVDSRLGGEPKEDWVAYLDGSEPRFVKRFSTSVHDGLFLSDGTYLDIIGGAAHTLQDGSEIGWKECMVPPDKQADTLNVELRLFSGVATYYQDETSLKHAYAPLGPETPLPFLVKKDTTSHTLAGSVNTGEWQAETNLNLNPVDLRGEIIVTCPESWVTAFERWDPSIGNPIVDWQLYNGNTRVEGHNLEGHYGSPSPRQLSFTICFQHGSQIKNLRLVPIFMDDTIDTEHAIILNMPKTINKRK